MIAERRGSEGSRPGSRRRRRKSMKRRSSGGPDVLLSTGQSMDSFLAHRRGSLPVEILATSFSGKSKPRTYSWWATGEVPPPEISGEKWFKNKTGARSGAYVYETKLVVILWVHEQFTNKRTISKYMQNKIDVV